MLSKHKLIAAVFLDVKKAFDSVSHHQLIHSLHSIGIQGSLLDWFRDYLSGRSQRVVLDGEISEGVNVTSGVPQGSILGPLMFNIFMNSISLVPLSSNCYLILYADDILLFKPIDNESDLNDFHRDLQAISDWILHHGLRLNHTKTQFLPISRSRNQPTPSLTLNGYIIPSTTSVKYLGVTISHNLTWSHHINDICRTTKRQLGRVHRQFRHAPCHLRDKIYRTTILPRLEYCCAVWDPHHSKDKQALENVQ